MILFVHLKRLLFSFCRNLEKVILLEKGQPLSDCLMCQAAETAKLCSKSPSLFKSQMAILADVANKTTMNEKSSDAECLQLKPGKRYSEANICKSAKCTAECENGRFA